MVRPRGEFSMQDIASRLVNISEKEKCEFACKFIDEYTKIAFGSLSSKETEIVIFGLFYKIGVLKEDDSIYTICRLLKIPPTRVKSLLMERNLRNSDFNDDKILSKLKQYLKDAELIKDQQYISVAIDDPLIKLDIEDRVKKFGSTPDYSFNKEILKISISAFSHLLEDLLSKEERKRIEKKIINNKKYEGLLKDTLAETFANAISASAEKGLPLLMRFFM